MKISPVAGAGAIQDLSTPEAVRTARAVAAFNKGQSSKASQTSGTPPINQNAVSAEDLSAIQPPTQELSTEQPVETNVEESTAETKPKEDPALSRQFAQLARQERALRAKAQQQEQSFKARLAELEAREAKLTAQPQFDPKEYIPKSRITQDALSVLEESGVSWDQLTQDAINRQPTDPRMQRMVQEQAEKIAKLEAAIEQGNKNAVDRDQAGRQAAIKQISTDAKNLIKSDPVAYEAIAKTGTVKEVVDLITKTFDRDGILLSVEEAAEEVENYLVEENYKMSTSINKIKQRMAAANASQSTSDVKTQATNKQQQTMKTLTNATASSRQLSAKERAILAFKGELKS